MYRYSFYNLKVHFWWPNKGFFFIQTEMEDPVFSAIIERNQREILGFLKMAKVSTSFKFSLNWWRNYQNQNKASPFKASLPSYNGLAFLLRAHWITKPPWKQLNDGLATGLTLFSDFMTSVLIRWLKELIKKNINLCN